MDLHKLTIAEAHKGLKKKEFTCVQLVQACLGQIEKHDDKIKAFVTIMNDEAQRRAQEIDDKIARGEDPGPLEGIPYSAKDIILTEGIKTTASSNMLKDYVAPYSATVIRRLDEAGAILIGKTNCDAYGHGVSNEFSDFFNTTNPWDTSKIPGGSSGGSAAAVATGMGLFSLGGDTGGSIRQPAALCGVVGLRPSYGRVPRYGGIAYASSIDTIGPVTKTAEDAALVMEVIAGLDDKDHTTRPDTVPSYSKKLATPESLTIGLPGELFPETLDPAMREIVSDAIKVLESAGHKVKKISLPHAADHALATYNTLTRAETSSNLERLDGVKYGHRSDKSPTLEAMYMNTREEGFGAENKRRIMLGTYVLSAGYVDAYYKKAQKVRTVIREDFDNAFKDVDVIAAPTSPLPAWQLGDKLDDPLSMYLADLFTVGFSLAGVPAISLPVGFLNKMPVGLQLATPYMQEELLFKISNQYQTLTDHHKKMPNLS